MGILKKKYKMGRKLGAGICEQCQTPKFMLSEARRSKVMGRKRRPRKSDYGLSLLEKQKVRFSYGIHERQFRNYVIEATTKSPKGVKPAEFLFRLLESRLDNAIYRLGFAHTRAFARQLASHGHFLVNGKRVDVPSVRLRVGDKIELRDGSKTKPVFTELAATMKTVKRPDWLSYDEKSGVAEVRGIPTNTESFLDWQAVIEFYTK